eukprot:1506747-Prymnesium_polylepis.1
MLRGGPTRRQDAIPFDAPRAGPAHAVSGQIPPHGPTNASTARAPPAGAEKCATPRRGKMRHPQN